MRWHSNSGTPGRKRTGPSDSEMPIPFCNARGTGALGLIHSIAKSMVGSFATRYLSIFEDLACINAFMICCSFVQPFVTRGEQLVHSEYLQCLASLALGLHLDDAVSYRCMAPNQPLGHGESGLDAKWMWLLKYCTALRTSEALSQRSELPPTFILPDMESAVSETETIHEVDSDEESSSVHTPSDKEVICDNHLVRFILQWCSYQSCKTSFKDGRGVSFLRPWSGTN